MALTLTNYQLAAKNRPVSQDEKDSQKVPLTDQKVDVEESINDNRRVARFFKMFADETRIKIFRFLVHIDEMDVQTFCRKLQQSQPSVSHHLLQLREAGLLVSRREGKHNFYRLADPSLKELVNNLFYHQSIPERTAATSNFVQAISKMKIEK